MLSSAEIRKLFLEFFSQKNHSIVQSDSLVPTQDPSLLFTTAGMVQFKSLYAGAPLPYKRAASCQKCLRAGGKGSDLENVGKTLRHHTFFEMLGNFSFGDYFKEEAIQWGWEFLTKVLNIPSDRFWVSVFQDDDEAYGIWKKIITESRIVRLSEKDNFWGPAGDSGACGPSSEIYVDLGSKRGCGRSDCMPGCHCERYLEIWNLVFPQYFQEKDGSRRALERCGIDTGMGLERLAFVVQGVDNNYQTDLFKPLVKAIGQYANQPYKGDFISSYHVIADHVRALVFAIADGVIPTNEGRGYVLRRILRRASRYAQRLEIQGAFLYHLVPQVIDLMKEAYPQVRGEKTTITEMIKAEEERFLDTLSFGLTMLEELIRTSPDAKRKIGGEDLFRLHDTYGFPLDMAREVAAEEGFELDEEGFKEKMDEQKHRARASRVGKNDQAIIEWEVWKKKIGLTEFLGYETLQCEGKILAILKDGESVVEANTGDHIQVLMDRSPFYGESGGQVGDKGQIQTPLGLIKVIDTQWPVQALTLHICIVEKGVVRVDDPISASIDVSLRSETARHHTATHLLNYALRNVLGTHIRQAGSLVDPAHLRFDFSHFSSTTSAQQKDIEDLVNDKILENKLLKTEEMSLQDALKSGAIAFFGDKYGARVRVVDIGGYHREFCGGTHVCATGDIGLFRLVDESSISSGVRRIEAVSGRAAHQRLQQVDETLSKICNTLSASPVDALARIEKIINEKKHLEKELDRLLREQVFVEVSKLLTSPKEISGIPVYVGNIGVVNAEILRSAHDFLKKKVSDAVIFLGSVSKGRVFLLCAIGPTSVNKGLHAGKIVSEIASIVGGGGGGKETLAQAGGKDPAKLKEALNRVTDVIQEMINK